MPPLPAEVVERVIALTRNDPPGEATHWTGAAMAEAAEISVSSVQRIWRRYGLQPHRVRQFKLSTDPQRREQGGGAVSFVIVRHGASPTLLQRKTRLGAVERRSCSG